MTPVRTNRAALPFLVPFLAVLFYLGMRQQAPWLDPWLPLSMAVAGLSLFIVPLLMWGRLSRVYDFEERPFFGQMTTGKVARKRLSDVGTFGVVVTAVGLGLWLLF